jgi:hypothetical protein
MTVKKIRIIISFLLLFLTAHKAYSYFTSSHRPNFTLPATTLTYERFLMEFGYLYSGTKLENRQAIGDLRARIGIFKNFETIFGLTSYQVENTQEEFIKGVGEGYFGFKLGLLRSPNNFVIWHPNLALLAGTILPTGDSQLREERLQPEVKGLISWPVLKNLNLEGNYNYAYLSEDDRKFHQKSLGIALKLYLFNMISLSAEVFSYMPETYEGSNNWYFNAGIAISLAKSLRIDIHGGKGIIGETDSYIAGGGVVSKVDIF